MIRGVCSWALALAVARITLPLSLGRSSLFGATEEGFFCVQWEGERKRVVDTQTHEKKKKAVRKEERERESAVWVLFLFIPPAFVVRSSVAAPPVSAAVVLREDSRDYRKSLSA